MNWAIYAPGRFVVVPADTAGAAIAKVLKDAGFGNKHYLARDWKVHEASAEEEARYAAFADAQTVTAATTAAKRPRRSVRGQLGLPSR